MRMSTSNVSTVRLDRVQPQSKEMNTHEGTFEMTGAKFNPVFAAEIRADICTLKSLV